MSDLLNEERLKGIANMLTDRFKKSAGKIKPEEWGSNYKLSVKIAAEIAVHAEMDKFPVALMKAKAPNETVEELKYREDTFEPITKSYWERALNTINRIWAEQNYSIKWGDEDAKEYFTEEYPLYESLITYFKSVLTPTKINDPNAVVCIEVGELPVVEDGEGGYKVDQSQELSPICKIYPSDRVMIYDYDDYCLLLTDKKSEVAYGNGKERTGFIFMAYDTEYVYQIRQIGKKIDYTFEVILMYEHGLGYLPVKRLGGKPLNKSKGEDIIYESYFMGAIPFLNQALKLNSTLDISISRFAYPIRSYHEMPCGNPQCKNGKIPYYDPANVDAMVDVPTAAMLKNCPDCNGTGHIMRFSPMRDYVHTPRVGFNKDTMEPVPFPGFAYISPDPTILEFNSKKITDDIEKAFMFMNIDVSLKGKTGTEADTATQAKIDREELFAFLLVLSQEIFGLLQFSIDTIYQLRYNSESDVEVIPPVRFEMSNIWELTKEISDAQATNAPDIVLRELTKDYLMLRFPAEKKLERMMDVIFYCDSMAAKTTEDVIALKAQRMISNVDAVLHEHIFYFLEEKVESNPNYLESDVKTIKKDMQKAARLKELEINSQAGGVSADSLMAGISDVGSDPGDVLGKVPLAVQQLALARQRAVDVNDQASADAIGKKIDELLAKI